jgi:hypothetical protein
MKTNATYLPREKYEAIMTKLGISWTEQSGFLKAEPVKGRRLYVAATKKVGRVDLSGFEFAHGTKRPDQGPFGRVLQQLDVTGTEEEVLARFEAIAAHLLTLQPEEKAPKAPKAKAPKAVSATTEGEVPAPAVDSPEAIRSRMELIKRVAAEKGVPVSARTLALAAE